MNFRTGDVALVVTNPPGLPYGIALAALLRRTRYCVLFHDIYPEAAVATGLIARSGLFSGTFKTLRSLLISNSYRAVAIGRYMQSLLCRERDELAKKIVTIENWADLSEVSPNPSAGAGLLVQCGLINKFVVQYAGNIGRTHDVDLLAALAERVQTLEQVHFLVIGGGTNRKRLESSIRRRRLTNMTILDPLPRKRLNDVLNACDVAVIPFIPGMAGVSVPSRMYNIMAAGKPIIGVCESESELARVIKEEGIGWLVPCGDLEVLAASVLDGLTNPQKCIAMGGRARIIAETQYSFQRSSEKYRSLLEDAFIEGDLRQVCATPSRPELEESNKSQ